MGFDNNLMPHFFHSKARKQKSCQRNPMGKTTANNPAKKPPQQTETKKLPETLQLHRLQKTKRSRSQNDCKLGKTKAPKVKKTQQYFQGYHIDPTCSTLHNPHVHFKNMRTWFHFNRPTQLACHDLTDKKITNIKTYQN